MKHHILFKRGTEVVDNQYTVISCVSDHLEKCIIQDTVKPRM